MNIKYGMFFIVGCSWISIQTVWGTYSVVYDLHLTGPEHQTVIRDLLSSLPKDKHKATEMKIDALKKFAETVQDPKWAKFSTTTKLTSWNPVGNLLYLERIEDESNKAFNSEGSLTLTCRGASMSPGDATNAPDLRRAIKEFEEKISPEEKEKNKKLWYYGSYKDTKIMCLISNKELSISKKERKSVEKGLRYFVPDLTYNQFSEHNGVYFEFD